MSKQTGKTQAQPRLGGRFQKKLPPIDDQLTDEAFINQVKAELYAGYFDPIKVKDAYKRITGADSANVLVMRRAILSYSAN